ncbi:hypothetical protein GINT2_000895 [Glugoides intestinalis]
MNSTTKEQSSAENAKEDPVEFKFKTEPLDQNLKDTVMGIYKSNIEKLTLPELAEKIKKDLDEKFPKGWIVFAGRHMVGACSYIENTLLDFEVEGVSFVIFQTYVPA